MLKRMVFPVSIIIITCFSCTSYFAYQRAEKAFSRGNYSQAVLELTVSLKRDPEQPKAVTLLQEAFPLAVSASLECARNSRESGEAFAWSAAADCLLLLHRLNDAVKELPPLYEKKTGIPVSFPLTYYPEELEKARSLAAEEQYQAGLAMAGNSNSDAQKKAHRYFEKALTYIPGYKDAAQRASSSREAATARISILPTLNRSRTFMPIDTAMLIYNTLLTHLSQGAGKKTYTKIIDRGNLEEILAEQQLAVSDLVDQSTALRVGGLLGANRIVVTEILQIHYTPPEVSVSTEKRVAEIPAETTEEEGDSGTEPTRTVNGVFIRFEKQTKLKLTVTYKLISLETSELITGDVLEKDLSDTVVWGDFKGDGEALTQKDREILSDGEREVRSLGELLNDGARQLGLEIAARLLQHLD